MRAWRLVCLELWLEFCAAGGPVVALEPEPEALQGEQGHPSKSYDSGVNSLTSQELQTPPTAQDHQLAENQ